MSAQMSELIYKWVFFGKIQKWISDLFSVKETQNPKKDIIFHDDANKQTQSCVQILKTTKNSG